jgi:hypothetical protein
VTTTELEKELRSKGFAFARAAQIKPGLGLPPGGLPSDWETFAHSWDELVRDEYMADGGRDRLRRHAVLEAEPGKTPVLRPKQPHYQSRDYNPLNGGVARWFEPIRPEIVAGETMRRALEFSRGLFERLRPGVKRWKIEVHQFRIEAQPGAPGRPTPEGMHRDGVDCVLVLLIRRENVEKGTTEVRSVSGEPLGSFTLEEPFDAALVDDARVMHGVTPVLPLDASWPAYRDVLVVTFAGN